MSNQQEAPAFMTLEEVGELLRMDVAACRYLARVGKIPGAFKVGRSWRVVRAELMKIVGES